MWDHTTWGDRLAWSDVESRRLVGWMYSKPHVGDEIQARMHSGKVGRFIVTGVEYCRDPRDMFFATVEDIGYEGEPLSDKWTREAVV